MNLSFIFKKSVQKQKSCGKKIPNVTNTKFTIFIGAMGKKFFFQNLSNFL